MVNIKFGSPCCCGCDFFKDKFNRADSTTIGGDWNEESGSWEIVSAEITTSDSNALISIDYDFLGFPYGFSYQYPWIKFKFKASNGDQIRLSREVAGNPYIIEIDVGASARLRSIYDSGGEIIENECDVSCAADSWHTLELKINAVGPVGAIFLDGDCVAASYYIAGPINSGAKGLLCLGTGSIGGSVYFDDFVLSNWQRTPDTPTAPDAKCPSCKTLHWPRGCKPPNSVEVEISGVTGDYSGLNNTYTLTRVGAGPEYRIDGLMIERTMGDGNPDFVSSISFGTEFIADFRFLRCNTNDYGVSFVSFYLPSYSYSNDVADYENFADPNEITLLPYGGGSGMAVVTV